MPIWFYIVCALVAIIVLAGYAFFRWLGPLKID